MQKLWTNDQGKIRQELEGAIREEVPFSLFLAGEPPCPLKGREVTRDDDRPMVVFTKEVPFTAGDAICYLAYRRPGQMLHSFHGRAAMESQQLLSLTLPEEILQVQHRLHQRADTAAPTEATLADQPGRQFSVADISQEGVRLIGTATPLARQGDAVGPLTLTLPMPHLLCPKTATLTIAKARVTRITALDGERWEIGLHLQASAEERSALEHFLRLRAVEEATVSGQAQGANI